MYYLVSGKYALTRPSDGQRRSAREALQALASADPPAGRAARREARPGTSASLAARLALWLAACATAAR